MDMTENHGSEKPSNGIEGLRHWRHDLMAGLMVSLTSLPLSLGIAVASGAPPLAGLMSAIIAGLIFPFLGGAYVTISGPAAGLAPALFAAMTALGHGHLDTGYPLLLAAICVVGAVQVVLSLLGAARLSAAFPVAVVEGMLASIGMMIIAKELPHFIGHPYKSHAFFSILAESPSEFRLMDGRVFAVGVVCLSLMFVLSLDAVKRRVLLPPSLVVVGVGLILGLALGVDPSQRIRIPENLMEHGIVMPNFAGAFGDPSLRWALLSAVLTLTMIDGVESLATIKAIDKIDPFRRRSDPDRTLLAMGVSNICSSLAGGLTIIPGGVKSKLCIVVGGRTLWANFYNALFLITFLLFGRRVINLIPYSALAAVLIHTGYKMCEPKVWRHVAHIGLEQILLFSTTVFVTLQTDLLMGIVAGMALKLLLNVTFTYRHVWTRFGRPVGFGEALQYSWGHLALLFRSPVVGHERVGDVYHLYFDRPMVCFNSMHLDRALSEVPADAAEVKLHVGENVAMIDHTSCDALRHFASEFERSGSVKVEIDGLDRMRCRSTSETGMRLAMIPAMAAAASVSAGVSEDTLSQVQTID